MADNRNRLMWKPELYKIQLEAPTPLVVPCHPPTETPPYFGVEYHGLISHKEAAQLLEDRPNGSYLVRKGSQDNEFYTLSWRFNNKVHHYKLYYDGRYYVKDKRYETMQELAADGLVTLHMDLHAAHITQLMHAKAAYQESPYVTLNRRKLRALSARNKEKKSYLEDNNKYSTNDSSVSEDLETPLIRLSVEDVSMATRDRDKDRDNREILAGLLVEKYSKEHKFKVHTFKGLNWCEFCANFLWGFTAQGVKCEDCGFIAHSKCSIHVPSHCMPDLKKLRGVFGIDLTTLLHAHSSTLPFVVRMCVLEIERRGMEQEGIYRISGFADEIEALKMELDKDGEMANLSVYSNINVVAGCLKLYLRLLPVPLITHQLHPKLIAAANMKSILEQVVGVREALTHLPPAHHIALQYMIQHLNRVSLLSNINKMTAQNLSTVFAPTLMAVPAQCTDLTQEIYVLELLITHSSKVFGM